MPNKNVDMSLTVDRTCETENGRMLSIGDKVEYLGHKPFGIVSIRTQDGRTDGAFQSCFKELR